jgi:hypothetical protein
MEIRMTGNDDLLYYNRRARQEREHADNCPDHGIAQIHLKMANAYERRIEDAGVRTESRLASIR